MANRFATLLANAKTRTLVLLVVGVLMIGVVIAVSQTDSPNETAVTERVSRTTEVPSQVKSTPGEQVSRQYQELQEQANIRGAQEAAAKGETFIPTLTGGTTGFDDTDFERQLSAAFDDLGGKCSIEEINRLRASGMNTSQIIIQLKCYGCSSAALGTLFRPEEILTALVSTKECASTTDLKGCSPDVAKRMKEMGYDYNRIAVEMKNNGCVTADIAIALKEAGANIDQITTALRASGANATEIANALTKAGFNRSEVLAALQKSGFSALDIAAAMSSIELQSADLAALQAQQQAASEEARRLAAQQEAARLAAFSQQRQNKITELVTAMQAQKTAAMQVWETVPEQLLVEGEWAAIRPKPADIVAAKQTQAAAAAAAAEERGIILKAGSILFATLDTAINSDEPGPVLATIVSGSLKGAKLLGGMRVQINAEKIALDFTAINLPNESESMGISAVAIDPDTARTALASNVDHHYLLRWGSLFASSFVEGYASAVANAGQTQTVTQGAAGTVTNTQSPPLDGRQQLYAGLAAVGTKWSEVVGKIFDTPITITIDQGTGIGVLITADLEYGSEPVFFTPQTQTANGAAAVQQGAAANNLTPEQAGALISAIQSGAVNNQTISNTSPSTGGQ